MITSCKKKCSKTIFVSVVLQILPAVPALAVQHDVSEDSSAVAAVPSVIVRGTKNNDDERMRETGALIVVSHADLVGFGDQSLSEAFRRLPGITLGEKRGGVVEVKMRGLGGSYTQILLNGQPTGVDFSIDSIAPDLIEKIEILRVPSAEYGTQATAGTINIILKKANRDQRQIKMGLAQSDGKLSPGLSGAFSGTEGQLSYVIAATADRNLIAKTEMAVDATRDTAGGSILQRRAEEHSLRRTDAFSVSPRLIWLDSGSDKFTWQGLLQLRRVNWEGASAAVTSVGTQDRNPINATEWHSMGTTGRSDVIWDHNFSGAGKMEWQFSASRSDIDLDFDFTGFDSARVFRERHQVTRGYVEQNVDFGAKLHAPVASHHALVMGWSVTRTSRNEYRNEVDTDSRGLVDLTQSDLYFSEIRKLALFAQDDWDVTKSLSLSAGLRWECMETKGGASLVPQVDTRFSLISPMLQTVWRFVARQQFRLGLARTYKAPSTIELIPHFYKVDNFNSPFNPDTQGNPNLRPELAWGVDGAYEKYFEQGGMISASVYGRNIQDVIRTRLMLVQNSWTEMPANDGSAQMHGIELEARFPLRSLMPRAPAINLQANYNRAWSHVDNVPPPDNRLDKQTPLSWTLGIDYRGDGQFGLGANYNLQKDGNVRISQNLSAFNDTRHSLDMYASWKFGNAMQLRLALSNLLHEVRASESHYIDAAASHIETVRRPSSRGVRLVLERTL